MKKSIINNLLMVMVGLGAFITVTNVSAMTSESIDSVEEGSNKTNISVNVGNVETPVYSVGIYWSEMQYDWVYDNETGSYKWQYVTQEEQKECFSASELDNEFLGIYYKYGEVYTDNLCSSKTTDALDTVTSNRTNYYYNSIVREEITSPYIEISDGSTKGKITPSIEWTSSTDYDWTVGKFQYILYKQGCNEITDFLSFENMKQYNYVYTDSSCSTALTDQNVMFDGNTKYYSNNLSIKEYYDLATNEIPEEAAAGVGCDESGCSIYYHLSMDLEIDEEKEIITPESGGKIGNVTITISATE